MSPVVQVVSRCMSRPPFPFSAARDTYSGIEQASADAIEGPDVAQQRDGVGKTDYQHRHVAIAAEVSGAGLPRDGHELAHKGEEEEHESADKLCDGGNDVRLNRAQRCAPPMRWEDGMLLGGGRRARAANAIVGFVVAVHLNWPVRTEAEGLTTRIEG